MKSVKEDAGIQASKENILFLNSIEIILKRIKENKTQRPGIASGQGALNG